MEGQKDAVRSSVAASLTSILGADQIARKVAEEELKALEVTEGQLSHTHWMNFEVVLFVLALEYGVVLAEMIASQDTPVPYRQVREATRTDPLPSP